MTTIRIYSYYELSEDAKKRAWATAAGIDYYSSEYYASLHAFRSLLRPHKMGNAGELHGERLATYIENRIFQPLRNRNKKVYYTHDYHKKRCSRIMISDDGIESGLTGNYTDIYYLKPMLDFIKSPNQKATLRELWKRGNSKALDKMHGEEAYYETEEFFGDYAMESEWYFTEDGQKIDC